MKDFIKIQNHGLQVGEILADQYVLGGVGDDKIPDEIINPSRDYRKFLPSFTDIQKQNGLETMNCTVYGTENGIQIYEKTKYGDDIDYDERTVGIGASTTKNGNSPHTVCEWIRNNGMTSGLLPFTKDINTWNEYYSPKPLTQTILNEAKKWLVKKEFKHRWLFNGGKLADKQKKLWDTLPKCAPGVSVVAWKYRNGKYYKEIGESDNHWCTLIGGEFGKFWRVLDHYDNIEKELEWDYDFMFAKQYYIKKKVMPTQAEILLQEKQNKLLMDAEPGASGDIGLVVGDRVLIANKNHPERLAHVIATYLIRNGHGIGINHNLWEELPKEEI